MSVATSEGFVNAESVLAMSDLALALAHFKEEGVEMFPEVLVAHSFAEVGRALQVQEPIRLGTASSASEAMAKLLKQAAPLCRDGWLAYVQIESSIEFGVARQSSSPLAVPLSSGIAGCTTPAILFYQDVSRAVRVVGARGSVVDINLMTARATVAAQDQVVGLAECVVENLPQPERSLAALAMTKVLTKALRAGHGALVAVVPGAGPPLPAEVFTDDVILVPLPCCLDFASAIRECTDRMTLESAYALDGAASLLTGMMSSDGITVFSSSAQVLAYRAFLRPTAAAATGGARRRTYNTLSAHVGRSLSAAFVRSQDGHMELKRMP